MTLTVAIAVTNSRCIPKACFYNVYKLAKLLPKPPRRPPKPTPRLLPKSLAGGSPDRLPNSPCKLLLKPPSKARSQARIWPRFLAKFGSS